MKTPVTMLTTIAWRNLWRNHRRSLIMLAAIGVCTWVVGKIYRVGILMHGSKPKIKDLIRWVKEA